ncbi:MAG TPA: histone deacetylase family protein [Sphingomicrobium sp.]
MRCFFDDRQRLHAPTVEFFNGGLHPAAECLERVDAILSGIGRAEAPADHGLEPIAQVHSADYLGFLQSAFGDWCAAGRDGDAFPYTFPVVGRRALKLDRIDARLGQYAFDTSTPISGGTWESAYWGAQSALSALDAVLAGDRAAFAFSRPPGHHAGRDYLGGYSYLNNAAIAAVAARCRVAILDVDYHHGNGTQDIVAGRDDIFFASIHADPAMDYPYYWGHADESGGNILNLPLPRGTDWATYQPALARAIDWIERSRPDLLIVSYGADTYAADPISHFRLETEDYTSMARIIAAQGLPTLIVMEGGYALDALGANVAAFLAGF